jgi:hypothetical protein
MPAARRRGKSPALDSVPCLARVPLVSVAGKGGLTLFVRPHKVRRPSPDDIGIHLPRPMPPGSLLDNYCLTSYLPASESKRTRPRLAARWLRKIGARSAGAEASRHGPAGPPVLPGLAEHSTAAARHEIAFPPGGSPNPSLRPLPYNVLVSGNLPGETFDENDVSTQNPRRLRPSIPDVFCVVLARRVSCLMRRLRHPLAIPVGNPPGTIAPCPSAWSARALDTTTGRASPWPSGFRLRLSLRTPLGHTKLYHLINFWINNPLAQAS